MSLRGIAQRGHLFPRTSTKPILLSEYLEQAERDSLIEDDRLTPEYKEWLVRMQRKQRAKR